MRRHWQPAGNELTRRGKAELQDHLRESAGKHNQIRVAKLPPSIISWKPISICNAGKAELRHHLQKNAGKPYQMRLADFHLLLWLAKQPNLDLADLQVVIEAVKEQSPVPEGYTLIIDSLAEL